MSAFKRFGPDDQVDNVLILEPTWVLSSGSSGWQGSPEGSASVSLYGGYNRQPAGVVREYVFQRTIQGTDSFGKLSRSEPITASVSFVYMTRDERTLTQRSNQRWGYEHWKVIDGLYDYYHRRDPDYVTASYDYYSMFFSSGSRNIIQVFDRSQQVIPTASFTMEAWIKPFATSSVGNSFTILSHNRGFKFYVDGTSGTLGFSSYSGSAAVAAYATGSSSAVSLGVWQHVAVTFDASTYTGSFFVDLQNVGSFTLPTPLKLTPSYTGSLNIGALWSGSITTTYEDPSAVTSAGAVGTVFHGFIGETRVWSTARSWADMSASHNTRITGAQLTSSALMSYVRFDEGPLAYPAPSADPTSRISGYSGGGLMGSGVFDYAALAQGRCPDWGIMYRFDDRPGPGWHPNDNIEFYPTKNFAPTSVSGNLRDRVASGEIQRMIVVNVPAGMFGRRIVPNTVSMMCRSFSSASWEMSRKLIDDGRGGLFISGSTWLPSTGSYRGVEWNKVGNVFYDEGLIVIKDPALLDFAAPWTEASVDPSYLLDLSFHGESRIPVKTFMCRIDRGDLNASLNQTFWNEEDDGDRVRTHPSGNLYISTVGLYNSDRELVGVARLAEPLRVRPRDKMNVKLRMDF